MFSSSYRKEGYRDMQKQSEAARKARNEYCRQWRKAHPDKVRAYNLQYWEKIAQQQAEYAKVQGAKNDTD